MSITDAAGISPLAGLNEYLRYALDMLGVDGIAEAEQPYQDVKPPDDVVAALRDVEDAEAWWNVHWHMSSTGRIVDAVPALPGSADDTNRLAEQIRALAGMFEGVPIWWEDPRVAIVEIGLRPGEEHVVVAAASYPAHLRLGETELDRRVAISGFNPDAPPGGAPGRYLYGAPSTIDPEAALQHSYRVEPAKLIRAESAATGVQDEAVVGVVVDSGGARWLGADERVLIAARQSPYGRAIASPRAATLVVDADRLGATVLHNSVTSDDRMVGSVRLGSAVETPAWSLPGSSIEICYEPEDTSERALEEVFRVVESLLDEAGVKAQFNHGTTGYHRVSHVYEHAVTGEQSRSVADGENNWMPSQDRKPGWSLVIRPETQLDMEVALEELLGPMTVYQSDVDGGRLTAARRLGLSYVLRRGAEFHLKLPGDPLAGGGGYRAWMAAPEGKVRTESKDAYRRQLRGLAIHARSYGHDVAGADDPDELFELYAGFYDDPLAARAYWAQLFSPQARTAAIMGRRFNGGVYGPFNDTVQQRLLDGSEIRVYANAVVAPGGFNRVAERYVVDGRGGSLRCDYPPGGERTRRDQAGVYTTSGETVAVSERAERRWRWSGDGSMVVWGHTIRMGHAVEIVDADDLFGVTVGGDRPDSLFLWWEPPGLWTAAFESRPHTFLELTSSKVLKVSVDGDGLVDQEWLHEVLFGLRAAGVEPATVEAA